MRVCSVLLSRVRVDSSKCDFLFNYCVAETSSFIKKLLPVKECLFEEIYSRLKSQGYYLDGRWKDFPDTDSLDQEHSFPAADQEDAVLAAFVGVANVIRKAAEEVLQAEGELHPDVLGATEWVNYHSRTPISEDKDDIGPNALRVLTGLDEH
ncbi:hypothetical protein M413DRAFT_450042 [Hebeloma cylindrosporum]|uniref:Uncharacterized protein n=1 Tax=Hebeloma cylindrosporum TaxID=76867 RepID=A0A0C3BTX3_HEBCY|nr:hypothetical protein M413DRAFT_450042 [Hebeloma cylindrosporum h7]